MNFLECPCFFESRTDLVLGARQMHVCYDQGGFLFGLGWLRIERSNHLQNVATISSWEALISRPQVEQFLTLDSPCA